MARVSIEEQGREVGMVSSGSSLRQVGTLYLSTPRLCFFIVI